MSEAVSEAVPEASPLPDPVSEPPFVKKTVMELGSTNTAATNDAKENEKNK